MPALIFVVIGTLLSVLLGIAAALYLTVAYIGLGVRLVVSAVGSQMRSVVRLHHRHA